MSSKVKELIENFKKELPVGEGFGTVHVWVGILIDQLKQAHAEDVKEIQDRIENEIKMREVVEECQKVLERQKETRICHLGICPDEYVNINCDVCPVKEEHPESILLKRIEDILGEQR